MNMEVSSGLGLRCRWFSLLLSTGNTERWRIDIGSGQGIYVGVRRMEMVLLCCGKELLMSLAWHPQRDGASKKEPESG